jgi:hypothetical protein
MPKLAICITLHLQHLRYHSALAHRRPKGQIMRDLHAEFRERRHQSRSWIEGGG